MASNLNKAFMRAYAKDRQTAAEVAATQSPTTQPAPVQPTPIAPVPVQSAPVQTAVPRPMPQPAASRPTSPMQPASRAAPATTVEKFAHSQLTAPAPTTKPQYTATAPAPRMATMSTAHHPTINATHRNVPVNNVPANNVPTGAAPPVRPQPPRSQPIASRPQTPRTAQASASQLNEQASGVWQRIDQAQATPTPHQTISTTRPTASVAASSGIPARRLQAAAAPPKSTQPISQIAMSTESPVSSGISDSDEDLPMISDQELALVDPDGLQSKRRTVADFLYAAGQYTPGRILAGHPAHAAPSAAAPTAPMHQAAHAADSQRNLQASIRTTVNSSAGAQPAMAQSIAPQPMMSQPIMSQPMMSASGMPQSAGPVAATRASGGSNHGLASLAPAKAPAMPMHESISEPPAVDEEPLPRRMGQILRVDVPRGGSMAYAAPTDTATETIPTQAPAARAQQPVAPAQPALPAAPEQMVAQVDMAARYVVEQRRLDRAHQISEIEEKLREQKHKVFNPVWEVDRLQWPPVVDKLMQQRAESMAQVAAHMKAACQDGLSVLGVSSAGKGEGRTTVACCLARLAASNGLNVCLVDIDLDQPTLCMQTNMEVEHDWRDCLSSDLTLEEVAVHSIEDHLTILPLKPRGGRPGLLASDSRLADMLAALAECFELVVVDCAKMNSAGNVISGLAHNGVFNAAILVVDRRDSEQARIEDAVVSIQKSGIESIGIVDNFSM